jgi:hypothetical protein
MPARAQRQDPYPGGILGRGGLGTGADRGEEFTPAGAESRTAECNAAVL